MVGTAVFAALLGGCLGPPPLRPGGGPWRDRGAYQTAEYQVVVRGAELAGVRLRSEGTFARRTARGVRTGLELRVSVENRMAEGDLPPALVLGGLRLDAASRDGRVVESVPLADYSVASEPGARTRELRLYFDLPPARRAVEIVAFRLGWDLAWEWGAYRQRTLFVRTWDDLFDTTLFHHVPGCRAALVWSDQQCRPARIYHFAHHRLVPLPPRRQARQCWQRRPRWQVCDRPAPPGHWRRWPARSWCAPRPR